MSKAEQYRLWLMGRMWRAPGFYGWVSPNPTSKKDDAALAYWKRHDMVEMDNVGLLRLTEKGRAVAQATSLQSEEVQNSTAAKTSISK